MLSLILLVFALVLFVVAGLTAAEPWRGKLLCFGLACLAGAEIVARGAPLLR